MSIGGFGTEKATSSRSLSMIKMLPSWKAAMNWVSDAGIHLITVTGLSLMRP